MEMISHQAISENHPLSFGASLANSFQKTLPISLVAENRLAPVAPIHDMVDRSGVLDAQLTGHPATLTSLGVLCQ
jgi:hypothetical protein